MVSSSCLLLHALALYFLVLPSQCASIAANATCYFPDGSVHKLGTPCRPAAGDGACCESTHACLSNGLCFDTQNNHVARLSCTDSTWSNSACPNYCNTFAPSSIADLRQCNGQNAQWICGQNASLCPDTTGSAKFAVSTGLIDDARSTSLTEIFLQAGPSTSPPGSAATGTAAGDTKTVTTTMYTTVTGTSYPNPSTTASGSSNTGTEAAVGVGVGVPLLLALIGMIWLYLREKKLRKAMVQVQVQAQAQAQAHGQVYPQAPVPMQYDNSEPGYNNSIIPQIAAKTPAHQEPVHELMVSQRRVELS